MINRKAPLHFVAVVPRIVAADDSAEHSIQILIGKTSNMLHGFMYKLRFPRKLFFIDKKLPAASTAHTKVPTARAHTIWRWLYHVLDHTLRKRSFFLHNTNVRLITDAHVLYENRHTVNARKAAPTERELLYLHRDDRSLLDHVASLTRKEGEVHVQTGKMIFRKSSKQC